MSRDRWRTSGASHARRSGGEPQRNRTSNLLIKSQGRRHETPESAGNASLGVVTDVLPLFLASRREGLSPRTHEFYRKMLGRKAAHLPASGESFGVFLKGLSCTGGGKHGYYRAFRAYCNWLYSGRSGFGLSSQDNPILGVDAPQVERRILPSLTVEQLDYLIEQADCTRDRAIVSLFADSGLRLTELANISLADIDWEHRLIRVTCKGNKEALAVLGERTERLLREWLLVHQANGRLWNIRSGGIVMMLKRLALKTGLPCNAHTFRRTFASILAKRGVDSLHIMRLGRWDSIQMVERYTRSVKFEDSLKLYTPIMG